VTTSHTITAKIETLILGLLSSTVCMSVYLSVGHVHEPCKNDWTDRDAVWGADSRGPKKPCIRWRRDPLREWAMFGGCPARWKALESLLQCTQQRDQ